MKKFLFGTKRRTALVAVLLIALSSGIAWAAWTTFGTGGARGATGSQVATITVTPTAAPAPDQSCYPSATLYTCDVSLEVSAGGAAGYHVVDASLPPTTTVTSESPAACPTSNLSINPAKTSISLPIAGTPPIPTTGTLTVVIPDLVKLDAAAPVGCAGVTFLLSNNIKVNAST